MKCIYCLDEKGTEFFKKSEHVIPQSFGVFKNNLILKNAVCDSCNQFFGDNLELDLGRDSFEGISRYRYKVKPKHDFKSVGKRSRLKMQVAEGPFKGAWAYIKYSLQEDKIVLVPLPQVGFLDRSSGKFKHFLIDEIPDKTSLEKEGFELDKQESIRILGCDPEHARARLQEKGMKLLNIQGEIKYPENSAKDRLCEVNGRIDDIILRAIAKIAFNYLAYWERPDFVMHSGFDQIREFIRYGQKQEYPMVHIMEKPILADEPIVGERRLGHIVTVNWAEDKISIVSQVTLFNLMTYCIFLARNFCGEHRQITRGHFFNVHGQEIIDMYTK